MQNIFGTRATPHELLRKNQAAVNRVLRELEREKQKMAQQESKLITEIRRMAKEGRGEAVKILIKDLIRSRSYVKKFNMMKANFRAISMKILTFRSYNSMLETMNAITMALRAMNRHFHLPQLQKILHDLETEYDVSEVKESMVRHEIDNVFGEDDDDEESEAVMNNILDELGLDISDQLAALPPAQNSDLASLQTTSMENHETEDENLTSRLNRLRNQ